MISVTCQCSETIKGIEGCFNKAVTVLQMSILVEEVSLKLVFLYSRREMSRKRQSWPVCECINASSVGWRRRFTITCDDFVHLSFDCLSSELLHGQQGVSCDTTTHGGNAV